MDTSLASTVLLNPDPTNPIIGDPYDGYQGPNIRGKEVHSPNIRGVSVKNTTNKTLLNPNIRGEDIVNSDSANPNIRGNPLNPNIRGTDVESPNIRGESISEITWEVENAGNTTTPYNFYSSTEYERPDGISLEEAMQFQLLIYRVYYTPVAEGCTLGEEEHHELITNIPGPNIRGTSIPDEAIENATFYLKPGEKALIKLLAIDPVPGNNDDFDFGSI